MNYRRRADLLHHDPTRAFILCHVSEVDTWSSEDSVIFTMQTLYIVGLCIQPMHTITMELSLCHNNAQYLCSSNPIRKIKRPTTPSCQITLHPNASRTSIWGLRTPASSLVQQRVHEHRRSAVVVGCANKGCLAELGSEIEKELEAEMRPEEGADWLGVGKLRDKCGEGRGTVELLECLEREAIMGEDEGKEPNDYNRRAQIFHKSSRVFQALKESTSTE